MLVWGTICKIECSGRSVAPIKIMFRQAKTFSKYGEEFDALYGNKLYTLPPHNFPFLMGMETAQSQQTWLYLSYFDMS